MATGCCARKVSGEKNCEPRRRSERRKTHAARRMLKINMLRMALINQAQTVSGMRGNVRPFARRSTVVTVKLIAVSKAAKQKSATLAVQSVTPASGRTKKAAVIPTSEAAVAQNENKF